MGREDKIAKEIRNLSPAEFLNLKYFFEEEEERRWEAGELELETSIAEAEPAAGALVEKFIKCSSPGCHCRTGGDKHGPYLYRAYKEDGKTRWAYVGKKSS